jgi:hypothetical protein
MTPLKENIVDMFAMVLGFINFPYFIREKVLMLSLCVCVCLFSVIVSEQI